MRARAAIWLGAWLQRIGDAILGVGQRLALAPFECRSCSEWPETGRHLPPGECPGLTDGSGCADPAQHHPWRGPWWLR